MPDRLATLVDAHTVAREKIRLNWLQWLALFLLGIDRRLAYADPRSLVDIMVYEARESRREIAVLDWTYLDTVLATDGSRPFTPARPGPAEPDWEALLDDFRGTPDDDVWERPLEQFRYAEHKGKDPLDALTAALNRAFNLAEADLALASRKIIADYTERNAEVTGYRRIIRPERSRSGTCGMCLVAATRVYRKGDLMPIHNNCKCDVLPIRGDDDPGLSFVMDDLQAAYDAAGGNTAADLKRIRYKVDEHGELGPVLVPRRRNKKRTNPDAPAVPPSEARNANTERMQVRLRAMRSRLADLQSRTDLTPAEVSDREALTEEVAKLQKRLAAAPPLTGAKPTSRS